MSETEIENLLQGTWQKLPLVDGVSDEILTFDTGNFILVTNGKGQTGKYTVVNTEVRPVTILTLGDVVYILEYIEPTLYLLGHTDKQFTRAAYYNTY